MAEAKSFRQLLAGASDFDLCDGVYHLLVNRYGDDLSAMPTEGKVVMWTLHAQGIIENGGFQYLFEGVFETDPHYAGTLAAYRTVGAEECAGALEEALGLFPSGKPPVDRNRRLQMWRRHGWRWDHPTVCRFWDGSSQLHRLVAAYIRSHQDTFDRIVGGSPAEPVATPDPAT
jgi:hypothetical protein